MKALVRRSDTPKDFSLTDVPEPVPAPDQVKIRVAYTGICGSDLHIYLGFEPGLPQGIHGHEFSGVITEVGAQVEGFLPGDRVTVEHTYATCNMCEYCQTGQYQLCGRRHSLGFDQQGAFTEYVTVYPRYIHKLPDSIDLVKGALTEPLACVVHGVEMAHPQPGRRVLVVGPGPMGFLTGLVFQAYGLVPDILGTPQDQGRIAVIQQSGLHTVTEEEVNDRSYYLVADCSGNQGGIRTAIRALKKGGTLLQVGIATKEISLPYDALVFKELNIQGTYCHTWKDWQQAIRLQEMGLLDISPVITGIETLDNWQDAFEKLLKQEGMKTLFTIWGDREWSGHLESKTNSV